jgi:mycothiol S-conjugate amidase
MIASRLMAIFAHPDDEGQIAGLLAKYAAKGAEVCLVSATRGELGGTSDASLLVGRTMGELREEELRCVCQVLGVQPPRFLNYQEGSFHTANPGQVIGRISETLQDFIPEIMITFGPEGVYGHRDHLAISRWVTAAFHATRQKSLSYGFEFPAKLYYTAYPRSLFERLQDEGIEFRLEIDGAIHKVEGVLDERITTVVDVSDYRSQKVAAFRCHRSQLQPGDFRWMIMQGQLMELLDTERLVRVFPPVTEIEGGAEGFD